MAEEFKKALTPEEHIDVLEKRKSFRVESNINVRLGELPGFKNYLIKNISGGGVFIETDEQLPMGTELTLHLELPDHDEALKLKGRVVWINPKDLTHLKKGVGIEFDKLDSAQQESIEQLIYENL
jgi:uncharacterized protein (TIGR02266 family)